MNNDLSPRRWHQRTGAFFLHACQAGVSWSWPLAVGVAAGAALLHWMGPVAAGVLFAFVLLMALPSMLLRNSSMDGDLLAQQSIGVTANGQGRDILQQVLPVWRRNVEAARSHSERSMEGLLTSFASVNEHLDRAMGASGSTPLLEAGAIDKLLAHQQPLLDALLRTTRLAVQLKDEMLDSVTAMSDSLDELVSLSKEVQTIGRATHLLALNASVEATRAGNSSGGFAVVAKEVGELAVQSRRAGADIGKRVQQLQERMHALRNQVRRHDTSDSEVTLQAEESAREVISSVLRSVSEVTRASRGIRLASRQVQAELEKIFMGLQSQDRTSQMLSSVTDDIARLDTWLAGTPDPAAASAHEWLARLESSYTMEEMRSSHHETVVVDRHASVEFF